MKLGLSFVLLFNCLLFSLLVHNVSSIKVSCNHTSIECECPSTATVCEFELEIALLQTFTRYLYTAYGETQNTAGRIWYLEEGEWHDTVANGPCDVNQAPIDDPTCTEPFAVDGETYRSFFAVNGRIPGPTLIVTQDQLVQVHVINHLEAESISIHWHGMHQKNSNWMDGVEHLTQCGIPPGTSFTYIFKASQYGTHWYHSHSGAQRTDGLYGSLIVREKEDDYNEIKSAIFKLTGIQDFQDYPGQHTLSFLDWHRLYSADVFSQIHSGIRYYELDQYPDVPAYAYIRTYSPDGAEVGAVPYWSGLINGRGSLTAERLNTRLSIFEVNPDTVYRFRLVGAQSIFAYRVSIEDHSMVVIASDGAYIEPVTVDYIIIHSGERYDFLLKTKSSSDLENGKYNFAIHALTLEVTDPAERSALKGNHTAEAILHYKGEGRSPPKSSEYNDILGDRDYGVDPDASRCNDNYRCKALNCPFKEFPSSYNTDCVHIHHLKSLFSMTSESLPNLWVPPEDRLFLNFGFEGAHRVSAINGYNLHLPSSPLAVVDDTKLNAIKNNEFCPDETPSSCDNNTDIVLSADCVCTHVKTVQPDRSIMIVMSAVGPNPIDMSKFLFAHPIHLHGHYFHVVDIQFGDYNDGQLVAGNDDIDCGGRKLCIDPAWKRAIEKEYDEQTGTVSSTSPLKDTILIPAGGYAVVYFKSNNPGWWFLHCHIEPHQMDGMSVIIDERGDKIPSPYSMSSQCGNFTFTPDEYQQAISDQLNPSTDSGSLSDGMIGFIGGLIGFFIGILLTVVVAVFVIRKFKKRIGYERV